MQPGGFSPTQTSAKLVIAAQTTTSSAAPGLLGRLRSPAGYTLIELLAAMSMFTVVMLGIFTIYDTASRDAGNEGERSTALTEETTGVAGMVQLLRQAYKVNGPIGSATSNYMDVQVRLPGSGDTRVIYNCAVADSSSGYDDCVRYEIAGSCALPCSAGSPGTATGVTVVKRVLNNTTSDPSDPVFTGLATPSTSGAQPTFGQITIKTPSSGELVKHIYNHQVVLSNSFWMRQLDFGR